MPSPPCPPPPSIVQPNDQHQQRRIRRHAQRRQDHHDVPAGPKALPPQPALDAVGLAEKLPIALMAAQQARAQDAGAVHGEQRADAVELGREDLQHDEREGELAQRGAHVRAFERALQRPDLDELRRREDDGARPLQAQMEVVGRVVLEGLAGWRGGEEGGEAERGGGWGWGRTVGAGTAYCEHNALRRD